MNTSLRRRLTVEHRSVFEYTEPARNSVMLVRLRPREDRGQRLVEFAIETDPPAVPVPCEDAFANSCHMFNIHREHTRTCVHSYCVVETAEAAELPGCLDGNAWDALGRMAGGVAFREYLVPSRFAYPCEALDAFAAEAGLQRGADPLVTLRDTCSALHRTFAYTPGSTDASSPIERILETRQGVCQDYTHVMIALARGWGIPGRYVSGYLHLEGAEGEQSPEGASHAWAEFRLPEIGWVGFDPTNDTVADHRHIRIAEGRDYADVAPTRGVVFGGGTAELSVSVTVTGHDGEAPAGTVHRAPADVRNIAAAHASPASDQQ